jgi:UDP-perosamine 4-acetyltransferase
MDDLNRAQRYVLIGDGGLAKEVADLIAAIGGVVVGRVVEDAYLQPSSLPGVGSIADLPDIDCDGVVLAFGDAAARCRIYVELSGRYEMPSLVHPTACVSGSATIGAGVLIMQNAVVSADAVVGDAALLNVGCYVAHDCHVGRGTHIGPGVQLGGRSSVGDMVLCGTSCTVLPDVSVGDRATCGAGAVVTRDVPPDITVVGVPAASIRRGSQA